MSTRLVLVFMALSALVLLAGACTPAAGQPPVEIVSVTEAITRMNLAGPVAAITLKNISGEPVIALSARLETSQAFTCDCDVSAANPLLPGKSTSARLTMITGGFRPDVLYPLTIFGTLKSGATFSFTEQVKIAAPVE
jgi:hypothetical protein